MSNDLVCLVPDKNIQAALDALLSKRKPALGLASFTFEIHVHPRRDPGCFHNGPDFLGQLLEEPTQKGLLVFDQAWQGNPCNTAEQTEEAIRKRLSGLFADVVVLEPELEAWVWSPSRHVDYVLGWQEAYPPLRQWLEKNDLWPGDSAKPSDPKAAMEAALFEKQIPRSSSLYRQIAERVSLKRCQDDSFNRLCTVLQRWFQT
jgi:hypothetical protein